MSDPKSIYETGAQYRARLAREAAEASPLPAEADMAQVSGTFPALSDGTKKTIATATSKAAAKATRKDVRPPGDPKDVKPVSQRKR